MGEVRGRCYTLCPEWGPQYSPLPENSGNLRLKSVYVGVFWGAEDNRFFACSVAACTGGNISLWFSRHYYANPVCVWRQVEFRTHKCSTVFMSCFVHFLFYICFIPLLCYFISFFRAKPFRSGFDAKSRCSVAW